MWINRRSYQDYLDLSVRIEQDTSEAKYNWYVLVHAKGRRCCITWRGAEVEYSFLVRGISGIHHRTEMNLLYEAPGGNLVDCLPPAASSLDLSVRFEQYSLEAKYKWYVVRRILLQVT